MGRPVTAGQIHEQLLTAVGMVSWVAFSQQQDRWRRAEQMAWLQLAMGASCGLLDAFDTKTAAAAGLQRCYAFGSRPCNGGQASAAKGEQVANPCRLGICCALNCLQPVAGKHTLTHSAMPHLAVFPDTLPFATKRKCSSSQSSDQICPRLAVWHFHQTPFTHWSHVNVLEHPTPQEYDSCWSAGKFCSEACLRAR